MENEGKLRRVLDSVPAYKTVQKIRQAFDQVESIIAEESVSPAEVVSLRETVNEIEDRPEFKTLHDAVFNEYYNEYDRIVSAYAISPSMAYGDYSETFDDCGDFGESEEQDHKIGLQVVARTFINRYENTKSEGEYPDGSPIPISGHEAADAALDEAASIAEEIANSRAEASLSPEDKNRLEVTRANLRQAWEKINDRDKKVEAVWQKTISDLLDLSSIPQNREDTLQTAYDTVTGIMSKLLQKRDYLKTPPIPAEETAGRFRPRRRRNAGRQRTVRLEPRQTRRNSVPENRFPRRLSGQLDQGVSRSHR